MTTVNENEFEERVLNNPGTVLVDFYADWCGPCKMQGPILEQTAAKRTDVTFVKVNVDESGALAARYGITSIPTLMVFRGGQAVDTVIGLTNGDEVERLIG